jgi:hypothetical protein
MQTKSFWDDILASPLSPVRALLFITALVMTGFWASTASHDYDWIRTTGQVVSVDYLCRYKQGNSGRRSASYNYQEVACDDATVINKLFSNNYSFDRPASYPHVRFMIAPNKTVIVRMHHHLDLVEVGDDLAIAHPADRASPLWAVGYLRGYNVWLWLCAMFLHLAWLPYEIIWRRVFGPSTSHLETASSHASEMGDHKYELAPWPYHAVIALTIIGCAIYVLF